MCTLGKSFLSVGMLILLFSSQCLVVKAAESKTAPIANIPLLDSPVKLDGKMDDTEWQDAAVLQLAESSLDKDLSSTIAGYISRSSRKTTAYLKHDQVNLWVAVVCNEDQEGYPEAYHRGADGNLHWDDSVQVVLGTADHAVAEREVLDMGGYKDAMNTQVARADHYYHFTVNAVGERSQTYNEFAHTSPVFDARVSKRPGQWLVEMKIPLRAAGIDISRSEPLFFNIYRLRPPEVIGWFSPAYGGYRAIRLGDLMLLDQGQGTQRTLQKAIDTTMVKSADESRPLEMSLDYFPLAGSVVGTIRQGKPYITGKATLAVSGLGEQTINLRAIPRQSVVVPLPKADQPSREATFKLFEDGQSVRQMNKHLQATKLPQWANTQVATAYVHDKIPSPWTMPVIDQQSVKLLDKQVTFGDFGLFDSVVHTDEQMFAGSAQVEIDINGKPLVLKPAKPVLEKTGHSVCVLAQAIDGSVKLKTRALMDYDGFTVVKMKLDGADARDITRFVLRIPLTQQTGQYMHQLSVQESRKLDGFGFSGKRGPLWCGNEDRGLSFNFDTPLFFSKQVRKQMRIVQDKDRVWMEFQFVDGKAQVPESDMVFRFFLQPTPTKPVPMQKNHPRTLQYKWEMWSRYQGYPDTSKIDEVGKWAKTLLDENRIPMLYTCQGLAEDAPEFKPFAKEMKLKPDWVFYRRHYSPGKGVPCYACCKHGPEGELQLWGMKQFIDRSGVAGILSDGLSLAWECDNPAHDACRPGTKVTWENDMPSRVVSQRQFLKRYRGMFSETGKPFFMSAHTGGGLDINTLSFFDGYLEGEQLGRFPKDYQIPLDVYTIGYSGVPWGLKTEFWIKRWRRDKGNYWALSYALLHDNELRGSHVVNELLKGFDDRPGTNFYPFWRLGNHVKLDSENGQSRMSYYHRKDSALVVVSNISYHQDQITLDLSQLVQTPNVQVAELLTDTKQKVIDGKLSLQLPPFQCVVLRVTPRSQQSSAQVSWESTGKLEDWKWVGGKGGVKKTITKDNADQDALTLKSTAMASQAQLQFALPFEQQTGTVNLMLRHEQRLLIKFGEKVHIKYYMGWSSHGFFPGHGDLHQPNAITNGRFVPVEISMDNGKLDITYNNQTLVTGMRLPSGIKPMLKFCTWGGNSMSIVPQTASSKPMPLYAGVSEARYVINVPPAKQFDQSNLPPSSWVVNTKARGVSSQVVDMDGQEVLELKSTAGQNYAIASLPHMALGRNGTVALKIQFGQRTRIDLGPIRLIWDGRWRVSGPKNGWGSGWVYKLPKVSVDKPTVMVLSLHDGLLDVTVDGQVFIRDMEFEIADGENVFSIATWAGFALRAQVLKISSKPVDLVSKPIVNHPVIAE